MENLFFRNQSIKTRLRKATLIILLVQVVLFGGVIFGGGTITKLKAEYFNILDEKVLGRKNYIQDLVTGYYSSLAEFEDYIQNEIIKFPLQESDSLSPEFLTGISQRAILTLRQSGATGIFVILEADQDKEGFYIRDLDPSFNSIDNSDLLMKNGPISIARNINASLDREWAYKFDLLKEDQNSSFYYKPFLAAEKYPDADYSDLGYWSKPFKLTPGDIQAITYSIPLKDDFGNPYGVVGIDLTLDHLYNLLPYSELEKNKQGGYILSVKDQEKGIYEDVISTGLISKKLTGPATELTFTKIKGDKEIYLTNDNIYNFTHQIDLYNTNTPFENDKWLITGIIEGKTLFSPITQLINSIILSLVISLLSGIIAIFIVGSWFIKPITKLVHKLLDSDPNQTIVLEKTNIREIDELAIAIESLSHKVADSASKLSQIISMVNVRIGAFEYVLGEDKVLLTDTLFDILEIENCTNNTNYVPSDLFVKVIKSITKNPELDMANIYSYRKSKDELIWIRMQTQEKNNKVLGVIEDVTNDIIEKRKIEYERDHDLLTHILNRRAFNVQVRKKMHEGPSYTAAFVMWDLDNLKYINDTYGHDHGDQYIKKAATVLNEFTVYNSIVARMSGDEFYTFIYGYKEKDDIKKIVQNMQDKLYNTFLPMPDRTNLRIRASAGISWYPDDSTNYEQLIKYSDFAMYEVKNKDKGNIGEFDKESFNKNSILLYGKEELNHLIEGELIKYAFQPIVDAKTGEIFAYEALMRPQLESLKSPLDVIRLAQSQSKLSEIERITWFKSLETFEENIDLFKDAKLFINSIPNHVLSKVDLNLFETKFKKHLSRIVIEIIETEQSNELCTNIKKDAVRRWGSHLALDDFGSGYNSEIALLILSPKYIKIDMNIIRGVDEDLNKQKLLQNILSYAKNRNIKVIAEGIETKAEMDILIELDVDYMQGYYLGKPQMTPQEIPQNIKNEIRIISH